MIDTSSSSSCSRCSPRSPCSGHKISSTGPSVSPFRDFSFKFGSSKLPQAVGKKSQLFPKFRIGGTLLFDTWSPLSAEESGLVGLSSPPGRDSYPTPGCPKKVTYRIRALESASLKVGKSLKIGKNWIKLDKNRIKSDKESDKI